MEQREDYLQNVSEVHLIFIAGAIITVFYAIDLVEVQNEGLQIAPKWECIVL